MGAPEVYRLEIGITESNANILRNARQLLENNLTYVMRHVVPFYAVGLSIHNSGATLVANNPLGESEILFLVADELLPEADPVDRIPLAVNINKDCEDILWHAEVGTGRSRQEIVNDAIAYYGRLMKPLSEGDDLIVRRQSGPDQLFGSYMQAYFPATPA